MSRLTRPTLTLMNIQNGSTVPPVGSFEEYLFYMYRLYGDLLKDYFEALRVVMPVDFISWLIFDYFIAGDPKLKCILPFGSIMKIPDSDKTVTIGCCTLSMTFDTFRHEMREIEYPRVGVSYAINGERIITTTRDKKTPDHISVTCHRDGRVEVWYICPDKYGDIRLFPEHEI